MDSWPADEIRAHRIKPMPFCSTSSFYRNTPCPPTILQPPPKMIEIDGVGIVVKMPTGVGWWTRAFGAQIAIHPWEEGIFIPYRWSDYDPVCRALREIDHCHYSPLSSGDNEHINKWIAPIGWSVDEEMAEASGENWIHVVCDKEEIATGMDVIYSAPYNNEELMQWAGCKGVLVA